MSCSGQLSAVMTCSANFPGRQCCLAPASETERKRLQIQYDYQDRVREINELKNAEQKVNLMAVNDEIRRLQTLESAN
jgi:hypothetical protein